MHALNIRPDSFNGYAVKDGHVVLLNVETCEACPNKMTGANPLWLVDDSGARALVASLRLPLFSKMPEESGYSDDAELVTCGCC